VTILLDSPLLVAHLRGEAACTAFLERHFATGSDLRVSAVTWAELLAGERLDGAGESAVRDLLALFRTQPVTAGIGAAAGGLLRTLARSQGLRMVDALLAATALEADCPLATLDLKRFGTVPGLVLVAPPVA
jgi:predicted nucleic acid-binding protein